MLLIITILYVYITKLKQTHNNKKLYFAVQVHLDPALFEVIHVGVGQMNSVARMEKSYDPTSALNVQKLKSF